MYNYDQMIYITSNSRNWISCLGMTGPIIHPIRVPVKVASAMLMCGHNVQEYDPNTGQVVELNLSNLRDDQKFALVDKVEQRTTTTVYTDGVKKEPEPDPASAPQVDMSSLSKAERKKMKREMAASTPAPTEDPKPEETVADPEAEQPAEAEEEKK